MQLNKRQGHSCCQHLLHSHYGKALAPRPPLLLAGNTSAQDSSVVARPLPGMLQQSKGKHN